MNSFDPNNLNRFLMACAGQAYKESDTNFNAGMAHLMACVKKYFNTKDFDIPIRDNNGWIATDDELPSKDNFYLVYQFNGHKDEYETTIKWFSKKEQKFLEWDFQDKATHWQYLPQPPKE